MLEEKKWFYLTKCHFVVEFLEKLDCFLVMMESNCYQLVFIHADSQYYVKFFLDSNIFTSRDRESSLCVKDLFLIFFIIA